MHKDFNKYNPHRKPDWRFRRILDMCDRKHGPPQRASWKRDDEFVCKGKSFLSTYRRLHNEDRSQLFTRDPGLYYAYQLHENEEDDVRLVVEARLLARQADEEIANQICTLPSTVAWYEALFFNVRDRLDNKDWVTTTVIGSAVLEHGLADRVFDGTAKLFAYFGGPVVLDVILDGFNADDFITDRSQVEKFFDRHLTTGLKRRSAMAVGSFEVNRYNVMELFAVHAKLMELERQYTAGDTVKSDYERNVLQALGSIPWGIGSAGREQLQGSPLLEYDKDALELRADEALRVSAGEQWQALDEQHTREMPRPRKSTGA